MRANTLVAGRFEIERLAGAGGMGSVYRARDLVTGGPVAVKVVKRPSSEAALRFEREARILARLSQGEAAAASEAIVGYVEHGHTGEGDMFLVMEWLEGESLSERLAQRGLTLAESVALGRRIAAALGYAHASGVVHRDVKPSNVFLPRGRVELAKLVDFGIAHLAAQEGELTKTGVMLGTPAYIAPEQARGERAIDARADVFSLGAVLYKCLTGRPPFTGDDAFGLLLKVISEPVTPPILLRPTLPEDLDRLVVRMLSKSPEARPRDGAAVAGELLALAPFGDAQPPPPRGRGPILAEGDRRTICLVAVAAPEPAAPSLEAALEAIAARHRGRLSYSGAGKWAISLGEASQEATATAGRTTMERILAPTDLAGRAARCALAVQANAPGPARIAVASGRFAREDPFPPALVEGAFDMLDAAPGGPIRVDDMTASLLDARFDVTRDEARLSLAGERGDAEIGRTLLGRATPCVGREQELVTVEAALATSSEEHVARAVLVLGAAGMGKSRLRAELLRRLRQREARVTVWTGAADAMGQLSAFSLLGGVLRKVLDIGQARDPGAALEAAVARRAGDADRARLTEFLGVLAGVPSAGEPGARLRAARRDARLMADQVRLAWEDLVAAECARGPVLLVLEDVQWADAASVDLVDAALRRMANGPFTVLALGRPETLDVFPALFRSRDVQEIRLGPLSKRASERLVRDVLGARCTDADVATIVERAGGNAFYLEELIRAAFEGSRATLPESVRAMIEARLGTLDPAARRIVRAASVLGQSFWRGGVRAILGGEVAEEVIDEQLADLVRRELCARRPASRFVDDVEYTFRHAIVRDAAYAALSEEDGRLVHRVAAEWLERAGERRGSVIAEHFERGGEPERATSGYVRAAEQALEGNDPVASIQWTERAIACGASGAALGRALRIQAEAQNWHGSLAEAERAALAAMERLPPGSEERFAAVGEAAIASARSGHEETLLSLVPELLAPAAGADAHEVQVQAVANAAIQLLFRTRYAEADALFTWLDTMVTRLVDLEPKIAGPLAEACGWRALFAGDPATYLALSRTAAAAYDEIGDLRNGGRALLNVGYGCMQVGDFEEAERSLAGALRSSERLGSAAQVIRHNLGLVLAHLGRSGEAIEVEEEALRTCDPANRRMVQGCELYLARIHLMAGRLGDAERHAERALGAAAPPALEAYGLAVQAMVRLGLGRVDEARASAERAVAVLAEVQRIDEGEAYIRLAHAEVRRASGDDEGARRAVAEAWSRLRERAAQIADTAVRERFLAAVPENARTAALAMEYGLILE